MKLLYRAAALALVLALPLAGCTTLSQIGSAVAGVQTVAAKVKAYYANAPLTLYVADAGYAIALHAAAEFKTTACPSVTSHSFCATAIPALRAGNHAVLNAFGTARQFIADHPDLDASAVIAAAEASVTAFAEIETKYGVTVPAN
jgi:hypothetical protein